VVVGSRFSRARRKKTTNAAAASAFFFFLVKNSYGFSNSVGLRVFFDPTHRGSFLTHLRRVFFDPTHRTTDEISVKPENTDETSGTPPRPLEPARRLRNGFQSENLPERSHSPLDCR
jgi:hypothetical protein